MSDTKEDDLEKEINNSGQKRKHITLTIEQKLEIIDLVEERRSSRQVIAALYGIGKTTVHDIHRQRDKIRSFANNQNMKRRRVDQRQIKEEEDFETKSTSFKVAHYEEGESVDYIEDIEYQEEYQDDQEEDYEVIYEETPNEKGYESYEKSSISSAKRKSKTLTFREKYDIIKKVDAGANVGMLSREYGIGRTTIYDYMKRKDEIVDFVLKTEDDQRRTFKKSKYPEIEEQLIDWCDSRESFTRPEFYEAAKGFFETAQQTGDVKNGFCGSWSWGKRFFHRHPQLKRRLVNADGEPMDPSELIVSMASNGDDVEIDYQGQTRRDTRSSSQKKPLVVLSHAQKLQVLDDYDCGINPNELKEKYNVSKTTVYSIVSKRDSIRDGNKEKENKSPRYPKLEAQLLAWCLTEKKGPLQLVAIADKARCIFDDLALPGNFIATNTWVKQFINRHQELLKRQNANDEPEELPIEEGDGEEDLLYEEEEETGYVLEEQEEDYIVEELDQGYEEEQVTDFEEVEEPKQSEAQIKVELEDVITDDTARSCLETLLKYYEQRGLDEHWSNLKTYHDEMNYDDS